MLDTFDEVKVCIGYKLNGVILTGYPDRSELLDDIEPMYESLSGWKTSLSGVSRFEDLPESARALVRIVERETGIPVSMIGTGPERDAVIVRDDVKVPA